MVGTTALYILLYPPSVSAQTHKQQELELREVILQMPSDMSTGLTWNRAGIDSIKTDTLATHQGKPDTTLVRKLYLTPSILPELEQDPIQATITYIDNPSLWQSDENDILELLLIHAKKAQPDTTRKPKKQNHQSIFSFLNLKTGKRYPIQETPKDTLIVEWYRSGGLNGWFPGQAPLDPRDKGSVVITIGNQKLTTTPPPARYNRIRQSLIKLLTTPPDTIEE